LKILTLALLTISILAVGTTIVVLYNIASSKPPNPATSVMTNEVHDLFLHGKILLGQTPPYLPVPFVRGKVLVWDMESNTESTEIEKLLPSEKLAKSPEERITIFGVYPSLPSWPKVMAVYLPEKIPVGPYDIESGEKEEDKALADWIDNLGVSDSLPASAIIDDIRGLILAANSTYQSLPSTQSIVISGKVLVWDFARGINEDTYAEKHLPLEIIANSTEGKITVFAIVKETETMVGFYQPGGEPGYQVSLDVLVVHYPEKEIVGRQTVVGLFPPSETTNPFGDRGDVEGPTAEWILSLPR
jgi:hypothetical protein